MKSLHDSTVDTKVLPSNATFWQKGDNQVNYLIQCIFVCISLRLDAFNVIQNTQIMALDSGKIGGSLDYLEMFIEIYLDSFIACLK